MIPKYNDYSKSKARCLVRSSEKILTLDYIIHPLGDRHMNPFESNKMKYKLSDGLLYSEENIIIGDDNIRDHIIKNLN